MTSWRLNGRTNRITGSRVVFVDDYPSPSEVTTLYIQDWISSDVGVRCVPRHLVVPTHTLKEHPPPPKTEGGGSVDLEEFFFLQSTIAT